MKGGGEAGYVCVVLREGEHCVCVVRGGERGGMSNVCVVRGREY